MNQEEIRQLTARDEKWVPTKESVKIDTTNVRLETTVPQKEETFQVIIDVIKNSTCFNAFTISAKVSEIFMQQFWYTVKKVTSTNSYEFHLANKKCLVNAKVFWKILDICPRLQGKDFTEVPDDESTLTFLIDLGYKEYGLPIPETMLTEGIKQSESYQMFIKYSAGLIPPKKIRGKGLQGKKTAYTPEAVVDVSGESDSEPARKRTRSRRVIKKKVTISADDNIIPDPDIALELGKSISLTEAKEGEEQGNVSKKMSPDPSQKLKGVQTLTHEERLAAGTMQALKASCKSRISQSLNGGSSEGTGVSPGVPDESTVIPTTSSKGTESEYFEDDEEKKDDADDDKSIDLEKTDDEETDNEFVHSKEYVQDDDEETDDEFVHSDENVDDDEDEEMNDVDVAETRKGDEEITDIAKEVAKKTKEVKDDNKKAELLLTRSSLSISLGFGNQFLNLSLDKSTFGNLKDTADAEVNYLMDFKIQYEVPYIQSSSMLTVPVLVILEPSVLSQIPKTTSKAPPVTSTITHVLQQQSTPILTPPITTEAPTITTTLPESVALTAIQLKVSELEKDVSELKKINHLAKALASLKSQVPTVIDNYLGSKLGDAFQKELQRYTTDLIQKYFVKPAPESNKIQTPTIDLER
ncbi:hypothetical protein Tco_1490862 [Tanacetum coccineum]